MLELRSYTKQEMSAMFGTRDMEGLKRKMVRYGIAFEVTGRGERAIFTILEIENPFKVYCITEFDFDANTDFQKALFFFYYFFNNDEFMAMPDEVKEDRMNLCGHPISRQTIAKYISKLEQKNLLDRNGTDFIYYFASGHTQIFTTNDTYRKAWREYWADVGSGDYSSFDAICRMIINYGGVARKQAIPELNAIYADQIEFFRNLIGETIEKEIGGEN